MDGQAERDEPVTGKSLIRASYHPGPWGLDIWKNQPKSRLVDLRTIGRRTVKRFAEYIEAPIIAGDCWCVPPDPIRVDEVVYLSSSGAVLRLAKEGDGWTELERWTEDAVLPADLAGLLRAVLEHECEEESCTWTRTYRQAMDRALERAGQGRFRFEPILS